VAEGYRGEGESSLERDRRREVEAYQSCLEKGLWSWRYID
jgi:hypothetical protein